MMMNLRSFKTFPDRLEKLLTGRENQEAKTMLKPTSTLSRQIFAKTALLQLVWLLLLILSLAVHLIDESKHLLQYTTSNIWFELWPTFLIHSVTWLFGFIIISSARKMLKVALSKEQQLIDQLTESKQNYRLLFSQMSLGFALHETIIDDTGKTINYRFLQVNKAFEDMTGLDASNIIGKTVLEILPGTEPVWLERYGSVASGEGAICFEEYSKELDRWFQVFAYSPQKGQFVTIITDVTERDKMGELLREYQYVIENSNDIIVSIDENHCYQMANHAALEFKGVTLDEFIGKPLALTAGEVAYRETIKPNLDKAFAGNVVNFILKSMAGDGEFHTMEINCQPLIGDDGRVKKVYGFIRDISDKLVLEEQLRQSQRLEAVGTLSGGVAHDFNNILTVIMGAGTYLQSVLADNSELYPFANQIVTSSERAAKLTQSLLAFSRKQTMQVERFDINDLIILTRDFLGSIIGENICMELQLSSDPLVICADRGQMEQVLMNLVVNARDSMSKEGLIKIATDLFYITDSHDFKGLKKGSYVLITVADNGCGMSQKVLERVFEPFFTTKDVGQGTGLGLSVVHGIVNQHEGAIFVESKPGQGTKFMIYLPLSSNTCQPFENNQTEALAGGSETILLVEDDADVRFMNRVILENVGYKVLEAANSEEALHVLHNQGSSVALIVMDLMMPGMNGKELANLCHTFMPDVPVLFVTGYGAEILGQKGIVVEQINLLQKPLNLNQFLLKVRQLIDETKKVVPFDLCIK